MSKPLVYVVDDDDAVRDSLELLLRSAKLNVETFESARAFLAAFQPERPGCVVLDVRMPDMSGLELQDALAAAGHEIPIIFVTGHGDVPMAVKTMKAGAIDFIQKPFRDADLLARIDEALKRDAEQRQASDQDHEVQARFEKLTPREQEVMWYVVDGEPNKSVAYELGISERTVEIHRANVMKKMEADSLASLVEMVVRHCKRPEKE